MDIANTFTYHKPHGDQPQRYEAIREAARYFAALIKTNSPASPEQTLALRDLQRCVMMTNAAIAIHEEEPSHAA